MLEFESMTPAGQWGDDCRWPVMDYSRVKRDAVMRSISRFVFRYEDGTSQKYILERNYDVTAAEGECDPSIASAEILDCEILIPDQKLVSLGFAEQPYTQYMQRFCRAREMVRYPTLFMADGTLDMGQPIAGVFLRYVLGELSGVVLSRMREYFWTGDSSNVHQFDGVLTQLAAGPISTGGGCDLLRHVELDWPTLVGGSGTASLYATITTANDSILIHGQEYTGNAGNTLVWLLRDWLVAIMEEWLEEWNDQPMEFDLWVPKGLRAKLAEAIACMQPCNGCANPMEDPLIRARAETFVNTGKVWFYPYTQWAVTIRESRYLNPDSKIILLPKTIGSRPTIGWTFRDMAEEQAIIAGELPFYGREVGGLRDADPLYSLDSLNPITPDMFEERIFSIDVTKNGNCISAFVNYQSSIILYAIHTWLVVNGVSIGGLQPTELQEDMAKVVTACIAVGGQTAQLDLTVADMETLPGGIAADDTVAVYFSDGVTQLIGTVISYNSGTNVLRLSFVVDPIAPTDFKSASASFGPLSVTKIATN